MSVYERVQSAWSDWWTPSGTPSASTRPLEYPQSFAAWAAWYSRLERAYLGAPYTSAESEAWRLFLGVDSAGEVIAETKRLTRDVQHVVDTDARAIVGRGWTLEDPASESGSSPALLAAEAVWARSGVQTQAGRWARVACSMGDVVLEAVRVSPTAPYQTTIAAYDPRWCRVEYDQLTGTKIERLIVEYTSFDPATVSGGVVTDSGRTSRYVRVVDAEGVTAYRDGALVKEESGPHGAGVCPVAHLVCVPYTDPEHGLWAAHGLDGALAAVDSLLAQVQAIGARNGSPLLAVTGARFADGEAVFGVGKIVSGVPAGGSVAYVEAAMQGVTALLEAAQQARAQVRETLPEFLFTDSGANSSGDALSWRASAFASKIEEIRGRWLAQLGRLTAIAVAMDAGRAYDEARDVLRVTGGPVLPVSAATEIATLHTVLDKGGLSWVDYIAHLQRLNIVPNELTPSDYADATKLEAQERLDREADAMSRALGPAPVVEAVDDVG